MKRAVTSLEIQPGTTAVAESFAMSRIVPGAGRVVTARARISTELQASELRYRRLFETAQDAILILDGDTGRVIDANPFVIGMLGYSLAELIGKELWQIGLFRDIAESKAAFVRLRRDGYIRYEDLPLETKDGRQAEVEFVSNVYKVGSRDIVQCNIRDITDRKAAEKTVREGGERFRFLAESMPQMIFTAQPDGTIDYFNQQWSEYSGLAFDVLSRGGWMQCVHPDDLAACDRDWRNALRTGEPFQSEHRLRRAGGVYRWHLDRAHAMRDRDGNIIMWVGSSTDIDEQKRAEESFSALYKKAELANWAKDEFLATLSHELRTPMTSILGWAALLTMNTVDEAARKEGLAAILRGAKAQAQLIDDVLDISRMTNGKLRLTIQLVDMESILRAALTAIVPACEAKNLEITTEFEPGLPRLAGDPARLQQVFWNLLSNAVKFTPAGGRIDVRLASKDASIIVGVRDTGVGIRPEFLPYAFDRFAQQESGTIRRHGGMGIGLSIVKELVELHGGTASVASDGPGLGSTFTVAIPVQTKSLKKRPASSGKKRRVRPRLDEMPSIEGLRVLVVDDEADSRRTIVAILEQYRAIVRTASSAAEAMTLSEREAFDVLLCDIAMPEEDGYSLIRRIRSAPDGKSSRIPAVALTAYGRPSEREIALAEGFNEYLKKPVEPEELTSVVARTVRHSAVH